MSWQTSLESNSQLVKIVCSDRMSSDDLTMLVIEMGFLVSQYGSTEVLLDLSKASTNFSAYDVQGLFDMYTEYHIPQSTRSAIVFADPVEQELFSKLMQASVRNGYEVGLFHHSQEARSWLDR